MKLLIILTLVISLNAMATTTKKTNIISQNIKTTVSAVEKTAPAGTNNFLNEVFTNVSVGSVNIEQTCDKCSTNATIDLHTSYLRHIEDRYQVGGEFGINYVSTGSNRTHVNLTAIGAYNFDNNFANAFFIKGGLGILTVSNSTNSGSSTDVGLFVGGGKRFALLSDITYSPEVRLVKKGSLDIGIEATVLNFSIHWN